MSLRDPTPTDPRPIEESTLCSTCRQALLLNDSGGDELNMPFYVPRSMRRYQETTWPDLPPLRDSESAGCGFCGFLLEILSSQTIRDALDEALVETVSRNMPILLRIEVERRWDHACARRIGSSLIPLFSGLGVKLDFEPLHYDLHCALIAHATHDSPQIANWLGLQAPIAPSYLDDACVGWMKEKLWGFEAHKNLQKPGRTLPKRLLDLTGGTARLVMRDEVPLSRTCPDAFPPYATLSYRWGSPSDARHQLTTTANTISQRRKAIPDEDMTECLRDAVRVCRALSIPYLWIDALCILQDGDADWNEQCADMATIYGDSLVTLGASSSRSCREGFLVPRGPRCRLRFTSKKRPGLRDTYDLRAIFTGEQSYFWSRQWDVQLCPWARRGWVVQEKGSAARFLIFGDCNVHFTGTWHDHRCRGVGYGGVLETAFETEKVRERLAHLDDSQRCYAWSNIIVSMCCATFSRPTDMLPALSGLAAMFHAAHPDLYAAGHWRRWLHDSLVWNSFHHKPRPRREDFISAREAARADYIVPSWSALSMDHAPFFFYYERHSAYWRFEDRRPEALFRPEMQLAGSNPFGALKSGILQVRSLVLDLSHPDMSELAIHVPSTRSSVTNMPILRAACGDVCKFVLEIGYDAHNEEDREEALGRDLRLMKLLVIGSCKLRRGPGEGRLRKGRAAYGLVLYPVPGSSTFYRVGVFYPTLSKTYRQGFRLLKRLGEVRDVVIE